MHLLRFGFICMVVLKDILMNKEYINLTHIKMNIPGTMKKRLMVYGRL